MVITQAQFNQAMQEINSSFEKLSLRVKELEAQLDRKDQESKPPAAKKS